MEHDGRRWKMVKLGLLIRLQARPGKADAVAEFLGSALPLALAEPATTTWFAIQMGPSTFGIFDAVPDESGRQGHLSGRIGTALMAKAPDLLKRPPNIEKIDILASKLPASQIAK
jgi:quinol monooxygenase YgiN